LPGGYPCKVESGSSLHDTLGHELFLLVAVIQ
jgi:hypothetical protein